MVDYLLKNGVDIHHVNSSGETAFFKAATSSYDRDEEELQIRLEIIRILLHYGAKTNVTNIDGQTYKQYNKIHDRQKLSKAVDDLLAIR